MELELKHLAAYLPYGLKIKDLVYQRIMVKDFKDEIIYPNAITIRDVLELNYKPILRPLSDYLEINSEAMIQLNCDLPEQIQICDLANKRLSLSDISVSAYFVCLENHIDVNRLIPARLAIDINTQNKNE